MKAIIPKLNFSGLKSRHMDGDILDWLQRFGQAERAKQEHSPGAGEKKEGFMPKHLVDCCTEVHIWAVGMTLKNKRQ